MEQFKYLIEELHRGEWKPLITKGSKVQRYAKITEEQAEWNNIQSKYTNLRYVKEGEKPKKEKKLKKGSKGNDEVVELRKKYFDKFNKKPFAGWGADKLIEKLAE